MDTKKLIDLFARCVEQEVKLRGKPGVEQQYIAARERRAAIEQALALYLADFPVSTYQHITRILETMQN